MNSIFNFRNVGNTIYVYYPPTKEDIFIVVEIDPIKNFTFNFFQCLLIRIIQGNLIRIHKQYHVVGIVVIIVRVIYFLSNSTAVIFLLIAWSTTISTPTLRCKQRTENFFTSYSKHILNKFNHQIMSCFSFFGISVLLYKLFKYSN